MLYSENKNVLFDSVLKKNVNILIALFPQNFMSFGNGKGDESFCF